mgnify:CR=1 FL=1
MNFMELTTRFHADSLAETLTETMNDQFYLQFVNNGIKCSLAIYFPLEQLRESNDNDFNDLSQKKWESLARYVSTWIDMKQLESFGLTYTNSFGISLCKSLARSLIA